MGAHQYCWRIPILLATVLKQGLRANGARTMRGGGRSAAKDRERRAMRASGFRQSRITWSERNGGTKRSNWRGDNDWDGAIRGRNSADIREREPANWPTKAGHGQERQGQPVCGMHVRGGNAQRPAIKRARRETTMFDTTGAPVRLAQCSKQLRVVGRERGVSKAVPEGGARRELPCASELPCMRERA